ncbi:isocitrate lyase/phosphoenolpyruvate mutase family protein [Amycolatopsis sp. NPDC059027]|uniref:isocitrate lyase/PEP mutase family protein n=1 Tax=Amycolatopsis sp. NPDC059027 TaxID=3346709 RepID=UPI00366BEE2F
MDLETQNRYAATFAALHRPVEPLLLPNAWDAASAAVIADAGAPAIATTSAGVAWSLGVPDAADLGAERAAGVVERITAVAGIPVSADIEAGYGPAPEDLAATTEAVVKAGAVGVNIEDRIGATLLEPAEQAERLAAARAAAERLGVKLWINARTDLFLAGEGPLDVRLDAALDRAYRYAKAGADSLFVPGLLDLDAIAKLVAGPLPVAVMAFPGAPSVADFAEAGAVRVSLGGAIAQAAYAVAARTTTELLTKGTYESTAGGVDYGAVNRRLTQVAERA